MRIRLKLKTVEEQLIDYNYNADLNNLIYEVVKDADEQMAEKLFGEGILIGDKPAKPYTFSRLLFDNYKATHKGLIVKGEGEWLISTPVDELAETLINGLIGRYQIKVGKNKFTVERHQMLKDPEMPEEMSCFMLAPVVTSVFRPDGREVFCHPLQSEFYDLLRSDLIFKVKQIYGEVFDPADIQFTIIDPEKFELERAANLIHYKGKNIKGYLFKFKMTGPEKVLKIAFSWGLGSFNYQGFGMIDFLR
ncbi:CRISPR-associated endoribonuclease Cas6 [Anoxybacter fermentans]|uniref:CRISPR-associated endoribonuclease n=1 Tax=Anoxybacter fermentans TaxID=1323375 RepID=A0A3Q9HT16_9FIRM|nr:CRISPR-associated endoribonuclease Cas6 [Anoxybacter fermentans]AZR73813.1 CRISPR-associated endoribonuclease Cas6 [Anoxybacter fermentans]